MIIIAALFAGGGDYSVQLPNGYELIRTNASTVMIWSPRGMDRHCVVPPKIVLIGRKGHLVFGLVERDPASDPGYDPTEGFFVLNTENGAASLGLTKDEWVVSLRKLGVPDEPLLRRPSRSLDWSSS
jgi:hypothetical protein